MLGATVQTKRSPECDDLSLQRKGVEQEVAPAMTLRGLSLHPASHSLTAVCYFSDPPGSFA
jgi:hypothetical protein